MNHHCSMTFEDANLYETRIFGNSSSKVMKVDVYVTVMEEVYTCVS